MQFYAGGAINTIPGDRSPYQNMADSAWDPVSTDAVNRLISPARSCGQTYQHETIFEFSVATKTDSFLTTTAWIEISKHPAQPANQPGAAFAVVTSSPQRYSTFFGSLNIKPANNFHLSGCRLRHFCFFFLFILKIMVTPHVIGLFKADSKGRLTTA